MEQRQGPSRMLALLRLIEGLSDVGRDHRVLGFQCSNLSRGRRVRVKLTGGYLRRTRVSPCVAPNNMLTNINAPASLGTIRPPSERELVQHMNTPNHDRTLIIIKPHAVIRGLTGRILARFEDMGLKIAELKSFQESKAFWDAFYPVDNQWMSNVGNKTLDSCKAIGIDVESELGTSDPLAIGRMVKAWLSDHMSSGRCVAAILQGNEAATKVRKACGATLPLKADPGTIRFDFSSDSPALANKEKRPVYNLIHATDPDEAGALAKELSYIFGNS